jgi:hypothetical protein
MTPANGYETGSDMLYEAAPKTVPSETAKIIPFPNEPHTGRQTLTNYISSTDLSPQFQHRPRTTNPIVPPLSSIDKESKQTLEDAFDRITDAADITLSGSERSNCFDDWQERLKLLVRVEGNFSRHHRRILGTLLSAVNKRDISDFNIEVLKVFRNVTNVLRQPRIIKVDSKRAISDILKTKTKVALPLIMENIDEEEAQTTEAMLAHLLEKSQLK